MDHAAISTRQTYGLTARLVDQTHNILLNFAAQYPFHHLHGFSIGHAHPLNKLALFTQAVEHGFNLGAAAMHHHGVDTHQLKQHHVFSKVGL